MNRYKATYNIPNSEGTVVATPVTVTAEDMENAVRFITADQGDEPFSMELQEQGAIVVDLTQLVSFTTAIDPAAAESAGSTATPTSYSVVPGTSVIFEAIAGTGYAFSKWTKDGEDVSTDAKALIPITQDGTAIVAVFVATP